MYHPEIDISVLKGVVLSSIDVTTSQVWAEDEIIFHEKDSNRAWKMYHFQDCCESVHIDDICGDLNDLIGAPILVAEEVTSDENPEGVKPPDFQESFTWTFYKLATIKGSVTIRWYGESNGYYSESVRFEEITGEG